jgi:hypothetical protein
MIRHGLDRFDFSQPATVHWINRSGRADVEETRPFSQAGEAFRFVMEKLQGIPYTTAWVTLDNGSLTLNEIELLYSWLERGKSAPDSGND